MIGGPTRRRRLNTFKPKMRQVERIDHANGIALIDPVIKAFRQQRRLPAIRPFNEALHPIPPQIARRIVADSMFSRSQGHEHASTERADRARRTPEKRKSCCVAACWLSSRSIPRLGAFLRSEWVRSRACHLHNPSNRRPATRV